jgi:hypothetical protein
MSPPRSILHLEPSPRKIQHAVHFPPSPVLTRAGLAHSPASYDRSPIRVEKNNCALPERGCPGRTYTLCEEDQEDGASSQGLLTLASYSEGKTLHPRAMAAMAVPSTDMEPSTSFGDDSSQASTQSDHPHLPSLIPDCSSSETDESDGLASPPHEFALFPRSALLSKARPQLLEPTSLTAAADLLAAHDDAARELSRSLNFLPHAPGGLRPRRRLDSKVRAPSVDSPSSGDTTEEDTADEDSSKPSYRRLNISTSLSMCQLDDGDEGCLAGF